MTGELPAPAPRRKIQALTVSVNYADFLECIAPNIRHFDRWLVVTDAADTATQEVCRKWGMEIFLSRRLYENGAVFHKAAALNEGLAALDADGWVAVMDSDILLPHDFRDRLEAQNPDKACLYGMGGRRICRTIHEFRALAAQEPWLDNLVYSSFVIGFFHLFHLSQAHNRYPEKASDDASSYDVEFSDAFPSANKHHLPFACLHAGDPAKNWRGRVTAAFFDEETGPQTLPPESCLEEMLHQVGKPAATVAQIGCFRGALSRTLAAHFEKVIVIDHFGLLARSHSAAQATDLRLLADRYFAESGSPVNLLPPAEHSDEVIAAIPDASLDVIWLAAEPEYDFLLLFLPAWLPKLKPGGAIVGGFYDPGNLPGPARVVHLLLGEPEAAWPDGHWVKQVENPMVLAARRFPAPVPTPAKRGVVYISTDESDVVALLVSLSSLRRHWDGAVCVLCAGDEDPSLRLACLRLGVEFRSVPAASADFPEDFNRLHALDWSPFEETVFIDTNTLVRGSLEFFFEALQYGDNAFCRPGPGERAAAARAAFAWRRESAVPDVWRSIAESFLSIAGPDSVPRALSALEQDSMLHFLPADYLWSGPAKRAPEGVHIVSLALLARGGALHLFPPWAEEEQALMVRMAGE